MKMPATLIHVLGKHTITLVLIVFFRPAMTIRSSAFARVSFSFLAGVVVVFHRRTAIRGSASRRSPSFLLPMITIFFAPVVVWRVNALTQISSAFLVISGPSCCYDPASCHDSKGERYSYNAHCDNQQQHFFNSSPDLACSTLMNSSVGGPIRMTVL